MVLPSYRIVNLAQAIASAALIVIAIVYFQNYLGLEPCYLCITQRVFVIAVGV
ncbi:MAG: disulfide bond formation protein B, partial [Porticoccaceae bacterium]